MKVDSFLNTQKEISLPSFIFPNCEKLNSSLYNEILNTNVPLSKHLRNREAFSVDKKSSPSYLILRKWIEELIPMSAHILAGGKDDEYDRGESRKGGGKWGYDFNQFKIVEMWSILFDKKEYLDSHNHFPYPISFVYYVNCPEGSSPFILENDKFFPKNGQLIFFMGHQYHCVPSTTVDDRCIVAGNINYQFR